MIKLAYLGPERTFSEEACRYWRQRLDCQLEFQPEATIPQVIQAVEQGRAAQGLLPIENSIEGSITITMDLLAESDGLHLIGEVVIPIQNHLATLPGNQTIQVVYSHYQPLAQCQRYLQQHLPGVELQPVASTAEAARLVAQGKGSAAAICTRLAAEWYGLTIIAENIQDFPGNQTRFVVVGKSPVGPSGDDKTSIVLAIPQDRPGGLYHILKVFADMEINLTRIESRPTKQQLGKYLFFLDCQGHAQQPPLQKALELLASQTAYLNVLGSYAIDRGGAG